MLLNSWAVASGLNWEWVVKQAIVNKKSWSANFDVLCGEWDKKKKKGGRGGEG